jgi:anti-sigma-K factor RskA
MSGDDRTVQYVLGELRPDERVAFERELQADAALAAEVRALQATLGALPYAKLADPPPELRGRVVAAAAAKHRPTPAAATPRPARRVVWSQFATAIAATIALAVGVDNLRVRRALTMQQDVSRLLLEPNVVRSFTLQGGSGFGTVALDMDAKRGAVVLQGMPVLPAGQIYRLWAEVAEKSVPCGDFAAAGDGTVQVQFRVPVEQYTAPLGKLFVTVEPRGPGDRPTGQRVMESV